MNEMKQYLQISENYLGFTEPGSDNTDPMTRQPTKSVLDSDRFLEVSWVRLAGSIHSHYPEAVQSAFIQVDHLKFGILAGVWSVVHLRTAASQSSADLAPGAIEIKKVNPLVIRFMIGWTFALPWTTPRLQTSGTPAGIQRSSLCRCRWAAARTESPTPW